MSPINYDALKARRAGNSGRGGWKAKDGANRIRILPPHSKYLDNYDAMTDLSVSYKLHYFRIEGRPVEVSLCLEQIKQHCPACAVWRVQRKSEDPGMKELAKGIGPSDAYLFNILDINNTAKGIQPWAANFTCWDKVMEVAGNPAWGNIVDPVEGLDFDVTLVPASKSRSKNNAWSVMPNPERLDVTPVLESIENWREKLDHLDEQITEAKTPDEITALLALMGFPIVGKPTVAGTPVAATPMARAVAAPAPRPAPAPAPRPVAATPVPAAPRPAAAKPTVAKPAPAPRPVARAPLPQVEPEEEATEEVSEEGGPHYDPGEDFQEVVALEDRPIGAPRCFGSYNPKIHQCQPCPNVAECQMKLLGIN